jgi:hypothetical protein
VASPRRIPSRSHTTEPDYDRSMPRLWIASMVIIVACLIASMVIAIVKLS